MTLRDALPLLENQGLKVAYKGKGRITRQSLKQGAKITSGSKIILELS
jgi:DNA-binding GntR family transcriptional regulator